VTLLLLLLLFSSDCHRDAVDDFQPTVTHPRQVRSHTDSVTLNPAKMIITEMYNVNAYICIAHRHWTSL